MKAFPPYSVVIPAHNSAKTLRVCLDSVFAQTVSASEIVIVLDSCNDDSRTVLESYPQASIKILEVNFRNSAKSRNYGVQNACSEIVAFLDADDTWLPGKMETQLSSCRQPKEISVTYSHFVNANRVVFGSNIRTRDDKHAKEMLLLGEGLPGMLSTWVMSRDFFLTMNGFNENLPAAEDFDFISRAVHFGAEIKVVRKELSEYLIHSDSKSVVKRVAQRRMGELIGKNKGKEIQQHQIDEILRKKVGFFEKKSLFADLALRRFMLTASPSFWHRKYYLLLTAFILDPLRFVQKLKRQA
jgi:glycosyltransferase involved in cell wall biosynthesis